MEEVCLVISPLLSLLSRKDTLTVNPIARSNSSRRMPSLRRVVVIVALMSIVGGLGLGWAGTGEAARSVRVGASQAYCTNQAAFVADVTVPDNTVVAPGSTFVKTWRLRNSGTCTWGAGYAAVFSSGARMNAASPAPLPAVVYPGGTVDLAIPMVAPTAPGTYRGNWLLRSDTGVTFGLGAAGVTPFYVQIRVGTVSPTPSPAPAQRITFQPGAISASVSMQLVAGVPKAFVLRANAGQYMTISVTQSIASIVVQAPSGAVLSPYSQGSPTTGPWSYQLPSTGDYRITLTGSGSNTMVVTIPSGGSPTPTPAAPQRITFQPGATSATISMQLTTGQPKSYLIRAGAGQVMTLTFMGPVTSVDVQAPGGLILTPTYTDGSTIWQFYLPRSGDNTITIYGSGSNRMTVEIPPA